MIIFLHIKQITKKKKKNKSHRSQSNHEYSELADRDSINYRFPSYRKEITNTKIDRIIRRWTVFQRISQFLCLIIIGALLYYGQKSVIDQDAPITHGTYATLEDSQVWLQCAALVLVLYLSWIPLQCSCCAPFFSHFRSKESQLEITTNEPKARPAYSNQGKESVAVNQPIDSDDEMDDPDQDKTGNSPDQFYVPPESA